jgi:hypothetical protein
MYWPYVVVGLIVLAIVGVLLTRKRAKTPPASNAFCTECGAEKPIANWFCGKCGKKLVARPTSQQ